MLFRSFPSVAFDRISSANLREHNINLIRGNEPRPFFYLCHGSSVVYVRLNDRTGNCAFGVPNHGLMPSDLLDTLEELLDCVFDRPRNLAVFDVASGKSPDPITSVLEAIGSESAEKVLRYARGQSDEIEPDIDLRGKADIAKNLVEQNLELANEDNSGLLLLLAQDLSERQRSPFAEMVRKTNSFSLMNRLEARQAVKLSEAMPGDSDDESQPEPDLLYMLSERLPKTLPAELTPEVLEALSAALLEAQLEEQSEVAR
jgi:hypothetical protein